MARLQLGDWRKLHGKDRARARLALIAKSDCVHGGARALTLAQRLDRMGFPFADYEAVVTQAYTSSTGEALDYLPFACPDCGSVHAGEDCARACCEFDEDAWDAFLGDCAETDADN